MSRRLVVSVDVFNAIEAQCVADHHTETGGVLLGRRVGRDYVVPAVTSSGPQARKSVTEFSPDTSYQQAFVDFAHEFFGNLNYLGDWHRHPGQNDQPSPTDLATARHVVTHPDWDTVEAVFPIAIIDRERVRLAAYEITRRTMSFSNIPIVVVPFTDSRLQQAFLPHPVRVP